jgi:hypothetical protein
MYKETDSKVHLLELPMDKWDYQNKETIKKIIP